MGQILACTSKSCTIFQGRKALSFLLILSVCVSSGELGPQIPSLASFTPSSGGVFELSSTIQIVVDSESANRGAPSLLDFANTFRDDLKETVPYVKLALVLFSTSEPGHASPVPTIHLTLDPSAQFNLYNGQPTEEGYRFQVTQNSYVIAASAPIGVWWGTRTLLQQAAISLAQGAKTVSFSAGQGFDSPGWEVRGFMLDAGRHWFEASFLGKVLPPCIYSIGSCCSPEAIPQEISAYMRRSSS